jgi:hypothetical protein
MAWLLGYPAAADEVLAFILLVPATRVPGL